MKIVNLNCEDFPKGKIFYLRNDSRKYSLGKNFLTDKEIIYRDDGCFWEIDEFFEAIIGYDEVDVHFFNDDCDDEAVYNVVIREN